MTEDFRTNPARDATDSIRGYVYQVYQSVLTWIELKDNELLVLEGAEDFDIHCESNVVATQVKDLSKNLTLRSPAIIETIDNYWQLREENPTYSVKLRFLTTALAGQEQGNPFGKGVKGLLYWKNVADGFGDVGSLKSFLLDLDLNSGLKGFLNKATDSQINSMLVSRIHWDLASYPIEALQLTIEEKLKLHGARLSVNTRNSVNTLASLIKRAADLLSTTGKKQLSRVDFLDAFDEATHISMSQSVVASVSNMEHSISEVFSTLSRIESARNVITPAIPTVQNVVIRPSIIDKLEELLKQQKIVFINGSSGLGKTNTASLLTHRIDRNWGWAGLRGIDPERMKDVLSRILLDINKNIISPYLVLDDINFSKSSKFESEFVALSFAVINCGGLVIVTAQTKPTLSILNAIWRESSCEFSIPYFDESDVLDLLKIYGLPNSSKAKSLAKFIWLTTNGHPQLTHARVKSFCSKNWPTVTSTDITSPDDIDRVKAEARMRLLGDIPNDNARMLAYRLSLLIGSFSRKLALAVANADPKISLPGESMDLLIGPWIEKYDNDSYQVSPLLAGAATISLSQEEITSVHSTVAKSIINTNKLNQFEIGNAFFHAYMAKDTHSLLTLTYIITTYAGDNLSHLNDAMGWYSSVGLGQNEKIIPDHKSLEIMMRIAQYKLIASGPNPNSAVKVVDRIDEALSVIDVLEQRLTLEFMALGVILNTLDVRIPSTRFVELVSRMMDISEKIETIDTFSDVTNSLRIDIPGLLNASPAQIMFSYQASKIDDLDDLLDLFSALNSLPANKREELLTIFTADLDLSSLLINRSWLEGIQDGSIDVERAINILNQALSVVEVWQNSDIEKSIYIAQSVIFDEYDNSTEKSLEILEVVEHKHPNDAGVINQRAKVLFHADRISEALPLANTALSLPNLPDIEYFFCCRTAGIAASKFGDWREAERFFLLGSEKAKPKVPDTFMGIGLEADAAFAQWKQEKYKDSLHSYANVLDALSVVPTDELKARHLHATVRHTISWLSFDARGAKDSTDLTEPFGGMCSNQEPHEGIKEQRLIDISGCWKILSIIEQTLNLGTNIRSRSEAATSGNVPIVTEFLGRAIDVETAFARKDFSGLISKIIALLEGSRYRESIEDNDEAKWSRGTIPSLGEEFWNEFTDWNAIIHFLLSAVIVSTEYDEKKPLPIEDWKKELTEAPFSSKVIEEFLDVFSSGKSDGTFYQECASGIYELRKGTVLPDRLWGISFMLMNAFMVDNQPADRALESLIAKRWRYVVSNQRFSLYTPAVHCRPIERECEDSNLVGVRKVAAILEAARPALRINLTKQASDKIKELIGQR